MYSKNIIDRKYSTLSVSKQYVVGKQSKRIFVFFEARYITKGK